MLAVLIQVLDTTIANVALPHMQASLGATQESINWVLTSYIVASAIALPIAGWLADRVGRKRLLFWSVIGFTVASFLCAVAQIAAGDGRLSASLQGISGAFLVPLGPGDAVRHQPARAARPGDGAVRRRDHDRPDPRAGARRLADRQLRLALGVPGQYSGRHRCAALMLLRFMPNSPELEPQVRPARLCAARPRARRAAADARPRPAERLVRQLGNLDRGGGVRRRLLDVRRPHARPPGSRSSTVRCSPTAISRWACCS